jgi:hypothetical protein
MVMITKCPLLESRLKMVSISMEETESRPEITTIRKWNGSACARI